MTENKFNVLNPFLKMNQIGEPKRKFKHTSEFARHDNMAVSLIKYTHAKSQNPFPSLFWAKTSNNFQKNKP